MTRDELYRLMLYWHKDLRDEFEERAAIYEYQANFTREEAEQRAFKDVLESIEL